MKAMNSGWTLSRLLLHVMVKILMCREFNLTIMKSVSHEAGAEVNNGIFYAPLGCVMPGRASSLTLERHL